jgi:probable O-glycosylation ligase (exosortase A-associated)
VTLLGFLFARHEEKRLFLPDMRSWIMVGLMAVVGVSLLASDNLRASDFENYTEYCKIIGVALFTTAVVRTRDHLRLLIWVIVLSFGFFGAKNGANFIAHAGNMFIQQGPGGMMADNNDFALALAMAVPLLLHLGLSDRRDIVRRVTLALVPLTIFTIIATHSRGGFLALGVGLMVLAWRSRNRFAGFAVLTLLIVAGILAAPQSYIERIATIRDYQTEGSAKGRLDAWKVAGNMIAERPLLGVGFEKFQQNYRRFDPNATDERESGPGTRVAHNSYLQIWAECGTVAFLLYMVLIVWSFFDLLRLRREAERRYHSSWILSYATMFEAAMAVFVVGSFFLNRAHFDLFYHFVAVILVFTTLSRRAMRDEALYPLRSTERARLALERRRGFAPSTRTVSAGT